MQHLALLVIIVLSIAAILACGDEGATPADNTTPAPASTQPSDSLFPPP